jgi:hypothetical protein
VRRRMVGAWINAASELSGTMTLHDASHQIAVNWLKAYHREFG